jgi:hypothetical protein
MAHVPRHHAQHLHPLDAAGLARRPQVLRVAGPDLRRLGRPAQVRHLGDPVLRAHRRVRRVRGRRVLPVQLLPLHVAAQAHDGQEARQDARGAVLRLDHRHLRLLDALLGRRLRRRKAELPVQRSVEQVHQLRSRGAAGALDAHARGRQAELELVHHGGRMPQRVRARRAAQQRRHYHEHGHGHDLRLHACAPAAALLL